MANSSAAIAAIGMSTLQIASIGLSCTDDRRLIVRYFTPIPLLRACAYKHGSRRSFMDWPVQAC